MGILAAYEAASGQAINTAKSSIVFSPNTSETEARNVKSILNVQKEQTLQLYLGLPTFSTRQKRLQFGYIRDRVQQKLNGWNHKEFSAGGREVLLKSVIQAIPTYAMQCFKLPNAICEDIERLCAAFWWGDTEEKTRVHWKRWSFLCKPKCQGGMGFRDIRKFNVALLAKQLWRMVDNPELLVARVFRLRYCRDGDMLQATARSGCSFVWRSILGSKEVVKAGTRWKVGKGETIKVYEDRWVEGRQVNNLKGVEGTVDVQRRVGQLLGVDGGWDEEMVKKLFYDFEREAILNTDINVDLQEDRRWWEYEPTGKFSVKSCYLAQVGFYNQHDNRSEEDRKLWSRIVWQVSVPPKVRVFLWRACLDVIPAGGNLREQHVPVEGTCFLCWDRWATTTHALFFCPRVRVFWKKTKFWPDMKHATGATFMEVLIFMEKELEDDEFAVWCIGVWMVWRYVCEVTYGDKEAAREPRLEEGRALWEAHQSAKRAVGKEMRLGVQCGERLWRRPEVGVYRVDVDAMFDPGLNRYGVGIIVRDWRGEVKAALSKRTARKANIMIAEVMAVVEGIMLSMKLGVEVITIFTDSLLTARAMAEEGEMDDLLPADLCEIVRKAKDCLLVGVYHMYRSANRAAHTLAQNSSLFETEKLWVDSFPRWLGDIVASDSVDT